MSKQKLFQLKLSKDNRWALKETVSKHITGEKVRIKVAFGLDAELRIVTPHLYKEGTFVDSNVLASNNGLSLQDFLRKSSHENEPIFFTLDNLTYICNQTIIQEEGIITKNMINIYVPMQVSQEKKGLLCNDVTTVFPYQNRVALAKTFTNYALSRV